MEDHNEEDFQMALRMSMQYSPPDPKRSKPLDVGSAPAESPEVMNRKLQRELMAAAAEKRMKEAVGATSADASASSVDSVMEKSSPASTEMICCDNTDTMDDDVDCFRKDGDLGKTLSEAEANQLFSMIFGIQVTKGILNQWCNQGIRFSTDAETSMGLVQHEGGPCGVLAAIQAFVIKFLVFTPEVIDDASSRTPSTPRSESLFQGQRITSNIFSLPSEDAKSRSLVRSMAEILFLCGSNSRATIATLDFENELSEVSLKNERIAEYLEGLSIESVSDLQKILRVNTYASLESTLEGLEAIIPIFQSRLGALLFLISALLSRGLANVQADRDDPTQALVTAPFGHASQEIVNLLLCGQAVANLFDGKMDLDGGMSLKGIPGSVEIGFLTLLESLNLCKVGHHLKNPKHPIWVVGSDSHYTVLFALDPSVQHQSPLEARESLIRRAFDGRDESGGGGFIAVETFRGFLGEMGIDLPRDKYEGLCAAGFVVWSELWQVLLEVDTGSGGLRDTGGSAGGRVFELYHFNGIAKSVANGAGVQRPRLTALRVSVPPRWRREGFMGGESGMEGEAAAQHAPLVDCIRTRWPRAACFWEGDAPSIV